MVKQCKGIPVWGDMKLFPFVRLKKKRLTFSDVIHNKEAGGVFGAESVPVAEPTTDKHMTGSISCSSYIEASASEADKRITSDI